MQIQPHYKKKKKNKDQWSAMFPLCSRCEMTADIAEKTRRLVVVVANATGFERGQDSERSWTTSVMTTITEHLAICDRRTTSVTVIPSGMKRVNTYKHTICCRRMTDWFAKVTKAAPLGEQNEFGKRETTSEGLAIEHRGSRRCSGKNSV